MTAENTRDLALWARLSRILFVFHL